MSENLLSGAVARQDAVVFVDNIDAGYLPGINILNGCSLTAHEGELIGIIGPNGAGKSTLLKAIFGLVNVRSGKIFLKGEDITNLKANKLVSKKVAFVPQTNNVFPSLTIQENLEMGVFQDPKSFNERFEFVTNIFPDLGKRRAQKAGSLSGGERQRAALARAMVTQPQCILADEPTGNLDRHTAHAVFDLLLEMNHSQQMSLVVVTHDIELASKMRRQYKLVDGKLQPKVEQVFPGSITPAASPLCKL